MVLITHKVMGSIAIPAVYAPVKHLMYFITVKFKCFVLAFIKFYIFDFFNVHIFEIPFSVRKKKHETKGGLDISPELRSSFKIGH